MRVSEELKLKISRIEQDIGSLERHSASVNEAIRARRIERKEIEHQMFRAKLDEELKRKQAKGAKWEKENPEEFARWFEELVEQNRRNLQDGADLGWWDVDEDGNMLSPAKRFKLSDFPKNAVMAHVMAKAGIFPSIGQARKNGHDTPIKTGEFVVTKRKIRIIVEDG